MRISAYITMWPAATLTLCVIACVGCAPANDHPYTDREIVRLEAGRPAPWAGWLIGSGDLEFLLKAADAAGSE